jgi:hypothetical protein
MQLLRAILRRYAAISLPEERLLHDRLLLIYSCSLLHQYSFKPERLP